MAAPANQRVILNPENELNNIPIKRSILNPENELNTESSNDVSLNSDNEASLSAIGNVFNTRKTQIAKFANNMGMDLSWVNEVLNADEIHELENALETEDVVTIERFRKISQKRHRILNLKTQKNSNTKSVSFLPSKAYAFFGHGEEYEFDFQGYDVLRVPKNCIIIVKALPSERTYYNKIREWYAKLFNPLRRSIYENPLCYMSEIINDFGSVRVYKPGDICPNFTYYLRPNPIELGLPNGYSSELSKTISLPLNKYGVIQLQEFETPILKGDINKNTLVKTVIQELYGQSILPTVDDFKNHLADVWETKTLQEAFTAKYNQFPEKFMPFFPVHAKRQQSEVLGLSDSTGEAANPGVYYNFICRSTPVSTKVYIYNDTRIKENIRENLPTFYKAPGQIRGVLEKRIAEAETARKHLIRGTKFNTLAPNYKARRTRRNRRTRQRKSRRAAR